MSATGGAQPGLVQAWLLELGRIKSDKTADDEAMANKTIVQVEGEGDDGAAGDGDVDSTQCKKSRDKIYMDFDTSHDSGSDSRT